jgi:hypothetical protein
LSELNFFTFTNKGYVDYTKNLLLSNKLNNSEADIKVYCLDDSSFNIFSEIHKNVELFKKEDFADKYFSQADENFGNLMLVKFELIYRELLQNENTIYVDGDIVFKKNFLNYLKNYSKDSDIIFQNDLRPSKPNREWVCAGFMYIKSNETTKEFFKPTKKLIRKFTKYKTHDQSYINKNRKKFKYTILPLDDFPNGAHFYEYSKSLDPYIIHFNYVRGDEKLNLMKKHGEWYL